MWTWTAVSTNSNTEGNSLTVRLLITKDSTTKLDKVEGYLSAYNATTGATTTEKYNQAVTWTNGEGTRTAAVTLANGTKTTSFKVYDGDGNNDVELLGNATLTLSESDGKLVAKHSVLNGGTEDDAEVETAISFDNEHQEHDMSVMTLFGVPYITKGTGTYSLPNSETGNFKVHYTECLGCGLAYLPEEHTAENEAGTTDSATKFTATKTCSVCGYDPSFDTTATTGYGSKYVVAEIDGVDTYVPVNTVLVVPFTDYTPFNKKSIKIVGWNSDEGIVWNGNGYLVSADGTLDAVEKKSIKKCLPGD